MEPGYPRSTSSDWAGLPGDLDASFTYTNGKMFFFNGSRYWRFSNDGHRIPDVDAGYPKEIRTGFAGIPNDVDAAVMIKKSVYFFKGSSYWKFDPSDKPPASGQQRISDLDGIPDNLDAAVLYSNGRTYFFKNNEYYRKDEMSLSVDAFASPPFPRETKVWWFGCSSTSLPLTKVTDMGWID